MIKLVHHNDGKQKWQSHEIYLKENDFYNSKFDVFSYNPFDVYGYGKTKEEALEDFMKKFSYIMDELRAFEIMLYDSNVITDNIVEVDWAGKEIKSGECNHEWEFMNIYYDGINTINNYKCSKCGAKKTKSMGI